MKTLIKSLAIASLTLASANALSAAPAVVVNPENADPVDTASLESYLVGKRKFWEGGSEVVIAYLKDDADANGALQQFANMDDSRFKSHWQRLAFSGRGTMPKQFADSAALIAFVKVNKGAIGLLTDTADLSGVKKVN